MHEETDFNAKLSFSQHYLDYITFNRIPKLDTIPDEVKEAMTIFIDGYVSMDKSEVSLGDMDSYSNNIEKITFKKESIDDVNKKLVTKAKIILPNYLTSRSVNFDVERYLQSRSNHSEQT